MIDHLPVVTHTQLCALINALDQYVENTTEAMDTDPDSVPPGTAAELAAAMDYLHRLNGLRASLAEWGVR